jgi:hypothetical protein
LAGGIVTGNSSFKASLGLSQAEKDSIASAFSNNANKVEGPSALGTAATFIGGQLAQEIGKSFIKEKLGIEIPSLKNIIQQGIKKGVASFRGALFGSEIAGSVGAETIGSTIAADTLGTAAGAAALSGAELSTASSVLTGGKGIVGLGTAPAPNGAFAALALNPATIATLAPLALMLPGIFMRKPPRPMTELGETPDPSNLVGISKINIPTAANLTAEGSAGPGFINVSAILDNGDTVEIENVNQALLKSMFAQGQTDKSNFFDVSTGSLVNFRTQKDRLGNQNVGVATGGTIGLIDVPGSSKGIGAFQTANPIGMPEGFELRDISGGDAQFSFTNPTASEDPNSIGNIKIPDFVSSNK